MSMKNSNYTIGNRTRDLPACSAVPQPTGPPRAPHILCRVKLFLTAVGYGVTECKAVHRNRGNDPKIDELNICLVTRLWVGRPTRRGPNASSNMLICTQKNPDQF